MYIYIYIYIYKTSIMFFLHAYIHIYIHTYIHTYTHTYIYTYIHTCIHTCIHTYTHAYIHTCKTSIMFPVDSTHMHEHESHMFTIVVDLPKQKNKKLCNSDMILKHTVYIYSSDIILKHTDNIYSTDIILKYKGYLYNSDIFLCDTCSLRWEKSSRKRACLIVRLASKRYRRMKLHSTKLSFS